jgi:iron complex outermembrane receptor protein
MNKKLALRLLYGISSIAAGNASPAFAQGVDIEGGQDIIVTARRTEERLQDVPISITAFNQAQLDSANVQSVRELAVLTPSLSVNSRFGNDTASFAIRGFTQENRTTASVGVYFADVVAPRSGGTSNSGDGAGPGNLFDLQNVQVLKGPQGTLFGRNTTGGAVLLVPKKPTAEFGAHLEGSLGNFGMRRVQAVVNVPVSDNLRFRAGVDVNDRNGYLYNNSGIGPCDFGDSHYVAARVSFVADLTPDLENYLIASYSSSKTNGLIPKLTDCYDSTVPGSPYGAATGGRTTFPYGTFACQQIAREAPLGQHSVSNYLPDARADSQTWQIINTTTWKAGADLTIKNIVSYSQLVLDNATDTLGLNLALGSTVVNGAGVVYAVPAQYRGLVSGSAANKAPPGLKSANQSTITEELQFQGSLGDGVKWQAGAYFEASNPLDWAGTQSMNTMFCPSSANWANLTCYDALAAITGSPRAIGGMSVQIAKNSYRSVATYAQADFRLSDALTLTGGIRYTWDRTLTEAEKVTYTFPGPNYNVANGLCTNPALQNPPGVAQVNLDPAKCYQRYSQHSQAPTWLLSLTYKPGDDVMLYAKYARGYRQGSTNPFSAEGYNSFGPEKVDTYEIGAKTSFRGPVRGTFNVALFYNDFRDQQLQATFAPKAGTGLAGNVAILNAGKSRIYGAEVETSLTPFRGFTVQASYAYLNSRLLAIVPPQPTASYDISGYPVVGNQLPLTPNHKLTVDARYTLPIDNPDVGKITLGATYIYTSSALFQSNTQVALLGTVGHTRTLPAGDDPQRIPAYDLVNFSVTWDAMLGTGLGAQFFITNAFGKYYYDARSLNISSGSISRYVGVPRMYGLRLKYDF